MTHSSISQPVGPNPQPQAGSSGDLVDKLEAALRNPAARDAAGLRDLAARYDWRAMAPVYDQTMEHVLASE